MASFDDQRKASRESDTGAGAHHSPASFWRFMYMVEPSLYDAKVYEADSDTLYESYRYLLNPKYAGFVCYEDHVPVKISLSSGCRQMAGMAPAETCVQAGPVRTACEARFTACAVHGQLSVTYDAAASAVVLSAFFDALRVAQDPSFSGSHSGGASSTGKAKVWLYDTFVYEDTESIYDNYRVRNEVDRAFQCHYEMHNAGLLSRSSGSDWLSAAEAYTPAAVISKNTESAVPHDFGYVHVCDTHETAIFKNVSEFSQPIFNYVIAADGTVVTDDWAVAMRKWDFTGSFDYVLRKVNDTLLYKGAGLAIYNDRDIIYKGFLDWTLRLKNMEGSETEPNISGYLDCTGSHYFGRIGAAITESVYGVSSGNMQISGMAAAQERLTYTVAGIIDPKITLKSASVPVFADIAEISYASSWPDSAVYSAQYLVPAVSCYAHTLAACEVSIYDLAHSTPYFSAHASPETYAASNANVPAYFASTFEASQQLVVERGCTKSVPVLWASTSASPFCFTTAHVLVSPEIYTVRCGAETYPQYTAQYIGRNGCDFTACIEDAPVLFDSGHVSPTFGPQSGFVAAIHDQHTATSRPGGFKFRAYITDITHVTGEILVPADGFAQRAIYAVSGKLLASFAYDYSKVSLPVNIIGEDAPVTHTTPSGMVYLAVPDCAHTIFESITAYLYPSVKCAFTGIEVAEVRAVTEKVLISSFDSAAFAISGVLQVSAGVSSGFEFYASSAEGVSGAYSAVNAFPPIFSISDFAYSIEADHIYIGFDGAASLPSSSGSAQPASGYGAVVVGEVVSPTAYLSIQPTFDYSQAYASTSQLVTVHVGCAKNGVRFEATVLENAHTHWHSLTGNRKRIDGWARMPETSILYRHADESLLAVPDSVYKGFFGRKYWYRDNFAYAIQDQIVAQSTACAKSTCAFWVMSPLEVRVVEGPHFAPLHLNDDKYVGTSGRITTYNGGNFYRYGAVYKGLSFVALISAAATLSDTVSVFLNCGKAVACEHFAMLTGEVESVWDRPIPVHSASIAYSGVEIDSASCGCYRTGCCFEYDIAGYVEHAGTNIVIPVFDLYAAFDTGSSVQMASATCAKTLCVFPAVVVSKEEAVFEFPRMLFTDMFAAGVIGGMEKTASFDYDYSEFHFPASQAVVASVYETPRDKNIPDIFDTAHAIFTESAQNVLCAISKISIFAELSVGPVFSYTAVPSDGNFANSFISGHAVGEIAGGVIDQFKSIAAQPAEIVQIVNIHDLNYTDTTRALNYAHVVIGDSVISDICRGGISMPAFESAVYSICADFSFYEPAGFTNRADAFADNAVAALSGSFFSSCVGANGHIIDSMPFANLAVPVSSARPAFACAYAVLSPAAEFDFTHSASGDVLGVVAEGMEVFFDTHRLVRPCGYLDTAFTVQAVAAEFSCGISRILSGYAVAADSTEFAAGAAALAGPVYFKAAAFRATNPAAILACGRASTVKIKADEIGEVIPTFDPYPTIVYMPAIYDIRLHYDFQADSPTLFAFIF